MNGLNHSMYLAWRNGLILSYMPGVSHAASGAFAQQIGVTHVAADIGTAAVPIASHKPSLHAATPFLFVSLH